jgi:hypothetical protein
LSLKLRFFGWQMGYFCPWPDNYCFEKRGNDRINYCNLRVVAVKGKVGYVGRESSSTMVRRSSYEARVVDVSKRSNC